MLGPDAIQNLARWFTLAVRRFIQSALDATNCVQRFLIRGGILHNQLGFAIDRENFGTSGIFKTAQVRPGIALKIRQ